MLPVCRPSKTVWSTTPHLYVDCRQSLISFFSFLFLAFKEETFSILVLGVLCQEGVRRTHCLHKIFTGLDVCKVLDEHSNSTSHVQFGLLSQA
jgi:hypothetical protein